MNPTKTAEPKAEPAVVDDVAEPAEPAEPLTVFQALTAVMGDVQSVSKASRNTSQNFNFRGIDAVMNAVGPALRAHGVVVLPVAVESEVEQYQTKSGTAMKNVTLDVTFRFYGPTGDYIEGTTRGEAADSGDKATAKAHSVAFRTLLLQALCIPTDEVDPDQESHERVHESGFQGGATDDRRPAERRVEAPPYNWPKSTGELYARMSARVGDLEAVEWIAQAVRIASGVDVAYGELPEDQQRAAWDVLTKILRSIEDETDGDLQLHPDPRPVIGEAFGKHLDGQVPAGPPWALTGAEAEAGMPSKEDVLAERAAAAGVDDGTPVDATEEEEMNRIWNESGEKGAGSS